MSFSTSSAFPELLRARLRGVAELSDAQGESLERHYQLMMKWNRVLNLTAITKVEEVVERHYCESVLVARRLPQGEWAVVDIGSGAGFPGIPLAVLRPECRVTLVDSHQRKAVFLREATRALVNVRVLPARADTLIEEFDWLVSRAVSYEDLAPLLPGRAKSAVLLSGAEVPPPRPGWIWEEAVKLPWGSQRFLRMGRRAEMVPQS